MTCMHKIQADDKSITFLVFSCIPHVSYLLFASALSFSFVRSFFFSFFWFLRCYRSLLRYIQISIQTHASYHSSCTYQLSAIRRHTLIFSFTVIRYWYTLGYRFLTTVIISQFLEGVFFRLIMTLVYFLCEMVFALVSSAITGDRL